MTLTGALRALRAAGRIKRPWLPGMSIVEPVPLAIEGYSVPSPQIGRVVASGPSGIQDIWWPGPEWKRRTWSYEDAFKSGLTSSTEDPATVGCLVALLREAHQNGGAYVAAVAEGWLDDPDHYECYTPRMAYLGETEGGVLADALIDLASQP